MNETVRWIDSATRVRLSNEWVTQFELLDDAIRMQYEEIKLNESGERKLWLFY